MHIFVSIRMWKRSLQLYSKLRRDVTYFFLRSQICNQRNIIKSKTLVFFYFTTIFNQEIVCFCGVFSSTNNIAHRFRTSVWTIWNITEMQCLSLHGRLPASSRETFLVQSRILAWHPITHACVLLINYVLLCTFSLPWPEAS